MARQLPLPPPRWPHLSLGGLPPPPTLPPRAGKPALCPSWPGVATLPVQLAHYPRPSSWCPARPPGHFDRPPKFQPLPAKLPAALVHVQALNLQWEVPPPHASLHLPLPYIPPLTPPWATTHPTPAPHLSLELTRIVYLLGVQWPSTPQGQSPPHTSACQALHNSSTSSSVCLSRHGTNLEVAGRGTTDTRRGLCPSIHLWAGRELVSRS